jgi:hypothetical protein
LIEFEFMVDVMLDVRGREFAGLVGKLNKVDDQLGQEIEQKAKKYHMRETEAHWPI